LRTALKNYLPAAVCAITPILCYFLIRPYAEIGINDDWSYIKSAQVLAQTGHIVYNGWGSPMLGWQLYLGAFFIKLFGFSFTAVRFSTVIEAVATAYLLQRTCVLAGLNSWNATLATMTFVLSPLYFPFAFTFMSDVSGVLCILACVYMCLRAVQTQSERSAVAWICLAALVNAVGGTVRQIAWLGLLVMVPCTLWLLRKSRRVLVAGCISWFIGVVFVAAAMHWFARQPYTIPVPLMPIGINWKALTSLENTGFRSVGQLALLALPVLLMFCESLRLWNRRAAAVFGIGFLCFAVSGIALIRAGKLYLWHAPFLGEFMTGSSWKRLSVIAAPGTHVGHARDGLGVLLTGAVVLGILCLAVCVFAGPHRRATFPQETNPISWPKLGILLGSFAAAYIVILALTALRNGFFFERYLLPLLAIVLLALARCYQERVKANLPWACILLIVPFAWFSLAATHDDFALYRSYVSATDEIRSSGVPATAILGLFEFEFWTQVQKAGYVNDARIEVPRGVYVPQPARVYPANCAPYLFNFLDRMPAIKPAYVVWLNPGECGGQAAFPPVMYSTWIAPHTNWIYTLKLPPDFPR
jgi:hypothetical protein